MEQYIKKSAIVAEIERRIASLEGIGSENYLHDNYPEQYAMLVTLKSLKFSIDTLEVKEVDLNAAVERYVEQHKSELNGYFDIRRIARYFFELGLSTERRIV